MRKGFTAAFQNDPIPALMKEQLYIFFLHPMPVSVTLTSGPNSQLIFLEAVHNRLIGDLESQILVAGLMFVKSSGISSLLLTVIMLIFNAFNEILESKQCGLLTSARPGPYSGGPPAPVYPPSCLQRRPLL